MFVLDTVNNLFVSYNYNSIVSQLSHTSTVVSYFPLCTLFNTVLFLKISFFSLLTSLEILFDIQLSTNMKDAICVAVKFLLCIALLIFARGGIPRFRFDYLTKLG